MKKETIIKSLGLVGLIAILSYQGCTIKKQSSEIEVMQSQIEIMTEINASQAKNMELAVDIFNTIDKRLTNLERRY